MLQWPVRTAASTRPIVLCVALPLLACAGPRPLGWRQGEVTRLELSDASHARLGVIEGAALAEILSCAADARPAEIAALETTHWVDVRGGPSSGRWEVDARAGRLRRLAHQSTTVFQLDARCRAALARAGAP